MKRIALITARDADYPRMIVQHLIANGTPPAAIFVGSPVEQRLFTVRSLLRVARRHGWLEVWRRFRERKQTVERHEPPPTTQPLEALARASGAKFVRYDFLNSINTAVALMKERCDLVLLAGCGLVGPWIAEAGAPLCLNAHPALLPGVRGVDVIEWSAIEERQFGITVHHVTDKIDAGTIVSRVAVEPRPGETLGAFRERMVILQAEQMANAAIASANGTPELLPNDVSKSVLRFATTAADREKAQRAFRARYTLKSS
jgi:methionyl-tRNA formyltransferase